MQWSLFPRRRNFSDLLLDVVFTAVCSHYLCSVLGVCEFSCMPVLVMIYPCQVDDRAGREACAWRAVE